MRRRLTQAIFLSGTLFACTASPARDPESNVKPFTTATVATFNAPWAISFLPGSGVPLTASALVTEKTGALWLVDTATGAKRQVEGVPAAYVAGQGGLGDVVAHPDFAANRRVYLSYVEQGSGGSGAVLGYGTLEISDTMPRLAAFKIIWRQSPKIDGDGHFAHRIAFGSDGMLYLTSGERQQFTPAQATNGNLGKVLRLTTEGTPAPGNPWAAKGGVAAQFWSIGHRNPLGLAFDADGRLWESEMGPKGGDEVNLIEAGKNYGWPKASNGSNYDGSDIPDHKPGDGFEPPKIWWNPSISPSGLMIYRGAKWPQWKGDAFVPALSGKALIRIDLAGTKATKGDSWSMPARLRAVVEGPAGDIFLLEDGPGAKLMRLEKS